MAVKACSYTLVHTIGELNHPCRVAVSDNDSNIIVTENLGHCVTVLDKDGKKVKSFGEGESNVTLTHPHGIVITPDNFILITDSHTIKKFTMNGECIASVGEYGSGPKQFNVPAGIAISLISKHIYVSDCCNNRIQVLNPDLTFSYSSFGSEGSADGQFIETCDIAIDSKGLLYATDSGNHRIQVFTPEGQFVTQFGTEGSSPGQLFSPEGITIDKSTDLVYVTEGSNSRISIFTSEGQFVNSFGKDQFNTPIGITLDNKGVLYVCDYDNCALHILDS